MNELDPLTLEFVARRLERQAGNAIYMKAWRAAAKVVRSMNKLTVEDAKLTDNPEQISSISSRPV